MANAQTDCRAVLERLYLYLDRELAEADCAEIDRHLDLCADCLRLVGFEREIKAIVGRKCRETQIPEGLAERLRARLSEIL